MALSIKQERFVSEFLTDGNGTAAAIAPDTASTARSRRPANY
jgi:phage terminase small subunit